MAHDLAIGASTSRGHIEVKGREFPVGGVVGRGSARAPGAAMRYRAQHRIPDPEDAAAG
jgi:hypothetical protein